jgi:D-amino-acid dehydrogenase
MTRIAIIGSGIIGLSSAYYLLEAGHEVTVIERGDGREGCSLGNAGMIVPSHFIPLAAPGMIEQGIKWMFDSESPFYIKPRLNWDLFSWGWKFYRAANSQQVARAMPALRDYGLLSKKLYQGLAQSPGYDFAFAQNGLMMLCKNEKTLAEEVEVAEMANHLGIEAKALSVAELHQIEDEVKPQVAGAVFYPGDAHCYPNALVQQLKDDLAQRGVQFLYHSEIVDFVVAGSEVKQIKVKDSLAGKIYSWQDFNQLVIATGSWSPQLAKLLRLNLPMQAGKGYSLTHPQLAGKHLRIPSILMEAKVAITPMSDQLIRFGGTMEIGGINDQVNLNRVRGIVRAIPEFFPDYQLAMPPKENVWHGLRPCSPDGLPYLGRTWRLNNLVIASGHAMMGLSLAPATGKLVQEIIDYQPTTIDIALFGPERYA